MSSFKIIEKERYLLIEVNEKNVTLGYSPKSGIKIIVVDGLPFKDFLGTGTLVPY